MNHGNSTSGAAVTGRFAPSPTGPFHFGLLVAAVGSYLNAKQVGGQWVIRIEDLDRSRIQPGSAQALLDDITAHALHWDGDPVWQSEREQGYREALDRLKRIGLIYPCGCSRREVAKIARAGIDGPVYPGTCRRGLSAGRTPRAARLRVPRQHIAFTDAVQGQFEQELASAVGDFIVHRADQVWSYQLAVVVDDAAQGITQIVRGADLLDSTPRQMHLQRLLGLPEPSYVHLPVAVDLKGAKVSKQTGAQRLTPASAGENLYRALRFLGQEPPAALRGTSPNGLIAWGLEAWDLSKVPRCRSQPLPAR